MQNKAFTENKMGVMPVNKLLISMSLPMAISMLVQACYNIVDSVYVSRIVTTVESSGLTAVSLSFPVQNLMIALASGTAVGVNALLSRSLGSRDFKQANKAAANGVFLALLSTVLFVLFGIFGVDTYFKTQTDIAEILGYGKDYLSICTAFSFGIFLEIMLERLLQSTGKTVYSMISQTTGAVINIVLDPILIFGWLGFPAMGVRGAAIATVTGQMIAMTLALYFNVRKNTEIKIDFKRFKPCRSTIAKIYSVGVPSIIMMSIGSVMTYCMNRILIGFTSLAVSVFGAYFKLQSFIFMPVFGLTSGMVPIVAYNYGAKRPERIVKTVKLAVVYATSMMLLGILAFELIPGTLLKLFDASPAMLGIGVPALRIICISFLFAGYCIVVGSVFQAMGNGMYSLFVSIARQLLVLLPAAYLLSLTGNLDLVWLSFPIAELASVAVSTYYYVRIYRQRILPLRYEAAALRKLDPSIQPEQV